MALTLYAHPFSSYSRKVLIALYENEVPFVYRHLEHPGAGEELAARWPFERFPVLDDDGTVVGESSIQIEHLHLHHPGPVPLLPEDPRAALEVRLLDRVFDLHVMTPMQLPVTASIKKADVDGALAESARLLEIVYRWLEVRLAGRTWAAGDAFSMADCAAAPSLFYADWVHRIGPQFPTVQAYRARLLVRPSMARCVEEARPYRSYFPLGAPDRD